MTNALLWTPLAFGLVVRSMGIAKSFGAGLTSLRQGEVPQYTRLLEDSRRHAIDRMVENARLLGELRQELNTTRTTEEQRQQSRTHDQRTLKRPA